MLHVQLAMIVLKKCIWSQIRWCFEQEDFGHLMAIVGSPETSGCMKAAKSFTVKGCLKNANGSSFDRISERS